MKKPKEIDPTQSRRKVKRGEARLAGSREDDEKYGKALLKRAGYPLAEASEQPGHQPAA